MTWIKSEEDMKNSIETFIMKPTDIAKEYAEKNIRLQPEYNRIIHDFLSGYEAALKRTDYAVQIANDRAEQAELKVAKIREERPLNKQYAAIGELSESFHKGWTVGYEAGKAVRSDWIDASHEIPPNTDEVLLCRVDGIKIGHYQGGKWYLAPRTPLEIPPTHWQPLPQSPKNEDDSEYDY